MLPETGFFRRYCAAGNPRAAPAALASLRDHDERLRRIGDEHWNRALALLPEGVGSSQASRRARIALYRALLAAQLERDTTGPRPAAETASYSADKDPRLIEYLPLLKQVFPESHIIHIVRDPRDVLLSKSRAAWSGHRNWRANLAAGRFQLDLADRFASACYGWRYHVLRYEDLLEAPERTLRRLTASLDVDYDERMLSFSDAAAALTSAADEPWKRETAGPLLSDNRGKWRGDLPRAQVRATEAVLSQWLFRYGYKRTMRAGIRGLGYRVLYGLASRLYARLRARAVRRVAAELEKGER
jgi:hypothetical protein